MTATSVHSLIAASPTLSARKGSLTDNASTLANVMLGMGVIGGAAILYGFASQLTTLAFGG